MKLDGYIDNGSDAQRKAILQRIMESGYEGFNIWPKGIERAKSDIEQDAVKKQKQKDYRLHL